MKQLAFLVVIVACNTPTQAPLPPQRIADDAPALEALRAADFDRAASLASAQLAIEPRDAEAAAIRALAGYVHATSQLFVATDMRKHSWFWFEPIFEPKNQPAIHTFTEQLAAIDKDLAIAGDDPRFSLELCLACWKFDWNHDGEINERDLQLFQIDRDANGETIPEGDARRMPTFRFDLGDVSWARAMISFQRAGAELLQSYRWSDLSGATHDATSVTIHLIAPERVKHAKELILAGLEFSERERQQYLAETDDDREWVPNPHQKNHPMPLPIDDKLYEAWGGILKDVQHLVEGDEGVSVRELAALISPKMFLMAPDVYVDFGRMLSDPTDIVVGDKSESAKDIDAELRGIIGHGYQERMKPSPLIRRIATMAKQLADGSDTFDRKLSYLMWIN